MRLPSASSSPDRAIVALAERALICRLALSSLGSSCLTRSQALDRLLPVLVLLVDLGQVAEEVGVVGLGHDRLEQPLGELMVSELRGGLAGIARRADVPGVVDERFFADVEDVRPLALGLGRPHAEPDRLDPGAGQPADLRGVVVEFLPRRGPQGLPEDEVVGLELERLPIHLDGVVDAPLRRGVVAVLEERLGLLLLPIVGTRSRGHRGHSFQNRDEAMTRTATESRPAVPEGRTFGPPEPGVLERWGKRETCRGRASLMDYSEISGPWPCKSKISRRSPRFSDADPAVRPLTRAP